MLLGKDSNISQQRTIIVTGDTTRPLTSQYGNIQWLYFQLLPRLNLTQKKVQYVLTNKVAPLNEWLERYKENIASEVVWLNTREAEAQVQYITTNTLLILWEMPFGTVEYIEKLGIPFIQISTYAVHKSFTINPVANIEDPIYGIRSNVFTVKQLGLTPYTKQDQYRDTCYRIADYCFKDRIPCPENTAVIFGQTPVDSSLVTRDGRVLTLQNYEDRIRHLVQQYNQVIFRPHPNDWKKDEKKEYMESLGCTLTDNYVRQYCAYDFMAEPKVRGVYAISSGTIYESEFFDLDDRVRFDDTYFNLITKTHAPVRFSDILQNLVVEW